MIKTHCSLVVVVLCSFVLLQTLSRMCSGEDSISTMIDAYYASAGGARGMDQEGTRKWLQEWRERFQKIVRENPKSPGVSRVRMCLLGLHNSLGDFFESQKLLGVMINEADSPAEKLSLYNEVGEIARIQAIAGKSPEDAQKAFDAYEKGYNIYKTLDEKTRGRMQSDGQQIYALALAGSLASFFDGMESKIPHYYGEARKVYNLSAEGAAFATSIGHDMETLLEGEMRGWVKCGNEDKAKEILGDFSALRNPRWDPSFYAKKCADLLYENKPIKYQGFVSDWLQKHPRDKRTAILMACLALSYCRSEQHMKALPILETLRNDYLQDFQREDAEAFKQGRGGYYDFIMEELMVIYLRRGEVGEAEKVQRELKKLLPNSKNINKLEQIQVIPDLVDMSSIIETKIPFRIRVIRVVLCSLGAVFIALGLYYYFRKEK